MFQMYRFVTLRQLTICLFLFAVCQYDLAVLACICPIPTIETAFGPDPYYVNNPAVLRLKLRQRADDVSIDEWSMFPDVFYASVRTAYWAQDCRTMQKLRGKRIQVRTGGKYSSCGSIFQENTTYLISGSLYPDPENSSFILNTLDCDFHSQWSALTDQEKEFLLQQRKCRCRQNACGPKPTDVPNVRCPNEAGTVAGPSDVCRYDRDAQQCSWMVECPACENNFDCDWFNYCDDDGLCHAIGP